MRLRFTDPLKDLSYQPDEYSVADQAEHTVMIPFPCSCSEDTGWQGDGFAGLRDATG